MPRLRILQYLLSFVGFCLLSCPLTALEKKVFVIGDSISMDYGPFLEELFAEGITYDRKRNEGKTKLDDPRGGNGRDSNEVLVYLESRAGSEGIDADVLLLNCGLHDIKRDVATRKFQVSPEKYRENLEKILQCVRGMSLEVIWIRTTEVNEEVHLDPKRMEFFRYNSDVVLYNDIADEVMSQNDVPVIDLYGFSRKFSKEGIRDHVHYYPRYSELQAAYIVGNVEALLLKK